MTPGMPGMPDTATSERKEEKERTEVWTGWGNEFIDGFDPQQWFNNICLLVLTPKKGPIQLNLFPYPVTWEQTTNSAGM